MKKIKLEDKTFIRDVKLQKKENQINIICQPYIIGMYICIYDSRYSTPYQISSTHKNSNKNINSIIENLKKQKYTIITMSEEKLNKYLDLKDLKSIYGRK